MLKTLTIKQGAKDELGGRVRNMGCYTENQQTVVCNSLLNLTWIRVKHSVGAATLLT